MSRSDAAGILLLLSFVLWLPAAALPARVWTAPLGEKLALITERRRSWQAVNLSIAAAAVVLVLGFAATVGLLERSGAGVVATVSFAALLLGAALWIASVTFRLTALVAAADTEARPALELLAAWAGGLFVAWTVLANAAVVGFGVAVVRSGYPATWCGWTAIVLGALMLAQLVLTGDALPALYHVAPGLIGIALLLD